MKLKEIIKEFCSTFSELHYFISGIAIGWSAGIVAGMYFMLKVVEVV